MTLLGTLPHEAVVRPDSGLARGLWEAPPWVFYLAAAAAIVSGIAWAIATFWSRRVSRRGSR